MRSERVGLLVGVLALFLPGTRAVAGDTLPPAATARLEVEAAPDCATRRALVARVASRSRRIQFEGEAGADAVVGPSLRVTIARGPGGTIAAELTVVRPGGMRSFRQLTARSCPEAIDAIALIIAVTLDPRLTGGAGGGASAPAVAPVPDQSRAGATATGANATGATATRAPGSDRARPPAPPRPPTTASSPTRASPSRSAAGSSTAAPSPTAASSPTTAPRSSTTPTASPFRNAAPSPTASASSRASPSPSDSVSVSEASSVSESRVDRPLRGHVGVGAAAVAIWGPAPRVLPGISLYASGSIDRESIWSPALFVRAMHASNDNLAEPGGTAEFALDAVSLDACPIRLRLWVVQTLGCGSGLLGRLSSGGSHTYSPRSAVRPFGTVGVSAVLTLTLGRIFELSARLGGGASLIRDTFQFTPEVFHRVSSATLNVDLGLGIRFP